MRYAIVLMIAGLLTSGCAHLQPIRPGLPTRAIARDIVQNGSADRVMPE